MQINGFRDIIDKQLSKLPPTESYFLFIGTLLVLLSHESTSSHNFATHLIDSTDFWLWVAGLFLILIGSISIFLRMAWNTIRIYFFRRKYNRQLLGVNFRLVEINLKVWLIETGKSKARRWIANTATFHDLRFYWDDNEKSINKGGLLSDKEMEQILKYKEGKIVLTRGDAGREPLFLI